MPVMSKVEQVWCRSLPWRALTGRVVLPWALQGAQLQGEVLEIGSGAGANAAELLRRHDRAHITATDVDPAMLEAARRRLHEFGGRATVTPADATSLPFADGRFDTVVSLIMLHHVIDWEAALGEVARVLRPGGRFVGYDMIDNAPARLIHRVDRSPHRLVRTDELRSELRSRGLVDVDVAGGLGGVVARFRAVRPHAGATAR
jgi:SAM-dependent methyltransferase